MKWIGNDIVDLKRAAIESNWQRKGYLQKIFTVSEQTQILSSDNPSALLWLFWSMKEAAYKIDNRLTNIRNFAPASLMCKLINLSANNACGYVAINGNRYFTESVFGRDYVHTCSSMDQSDFKRIEYTIHENPHPANFRETNPASISHHGRYLALAYLHI